MAFGGGEYAGVLILVLMLEFDDMGIYWYIDCSRRLIVEVRPLASGISTRIGLLELFEVAGGGSAGTLEEALRKGVGGGLGGRLGGGLGGGLGEGIGGGLGRGFAEEFEGLDEGEKT